MALHTYDPSQVAVVFAGIPINGYADGTFLNVEQNEDSFTLTIGSDGEGCRAKSNNRSGRVTFTLGQWSMANDLLSAVHNVDINTPNGDGIGPLLIKDNSGRSIYTAEKAWIVKPPAAAFGREAESREWVIETDNLIQFHGGN
jgi:hypothetical protein